VLIALGICGGIGAYKAVEVARGLQKRGHDVVAIMTHSATRFVGPVTLEAITRRRVITGQFEPGTNSDIEHISLASTIDLLLVAPATANVIGKFANGIADDFLTTLYTATRSPVLMAPAMNTQMFSHHAVRRNIDVLTSDGVRFVEPGAGYLACGWIGKGRLAEPDEICAAVDALFKPAGPLAGRRIVVTAGPTYEDVDPVRFIGNRSSGRMGFAVADEAARRGALVTVIAGPATAPPPAVQELVHVRSAEEMQAAVMTHGAGADVVVMAAAVADYAPVSPAVHKVPKGADTITLTLKKTPDILQLLGERRLSTGRPAVLVGFAAETQTVVARATEKLRLKRADLIVANDVSRSDAGFAVETNEVTLVTSGDAEVVPLQSKAGVASVILDRIERLLVNSTSPAAKA
jgi:phosphopantothenoylcysteine decarboxylase/phosphopantothenate--cysteine ligase